MSQEPKSFLGIGWNFPPKFNKETASTTMVADEADIEQSLKIILFTSYGERIMLPEFGSNLMSSVFDSVDSVMINVLKDNITQAVLEFEPRVTLNEVHIDETDVYDGIIRIKLDYTIRKINVRTNIVFPFYFKEGTNISNM